MAKPSRVLLLLLLSTPACDKGGGDTQCPDAPASGEASPATGDAVLATVASAAPNAQGVDKVEVRLDKSGRVVKQAVYHLDASLVPEPVKATAQREFPDSNVTHYETERYADLGDIYEVEVDTADGRSCEVAAKADGSLIYTECRADPATASPEIIAAIEAAVPGGEIKEYEVKKGEGIDEVTAEVEAGGQEYYLHLEPDGTLLDKRIRVPALIEVPLD